MLSNHPAAPNNSNSNPNPNSHPNPQINRTQSSQTLTQFGPQSPVPSLSLLREADTATTAMASTAEDDERGAAFYDEDDDDSDDGVDSEEEYDDDAVADGHAAAPPPAAASAAQQLLHSSSSASNPSPNPSASAPIPQNDGGGSVAFVASPDGKRQMILPPGNERKRLAVVHDESRRLFQKLWTDADEIAILQGFLEFTLQRGTTHANYQHDTAD